MKVIIVKDCKDGKVNDVIDVSAGYATNFLVKNKFAIPFNNKTKHMLKNRIENLEHQEDIKKASANKAKAKIESLTLQFKLKTTDLVVHGSVTKKQIIKELSNKGIKVPTHAIDSIKIASLGITKVDVKLYKDIVAILKVEVKSEK